MSVNRGKRPPQSGLRAVMGEGNELLRVHKISDIMSEGTTGSLYGTFGGFVALSAAYVASVLLPNFGMLSAAPIALGLGVTSGLMIYRHTPGGQAEHLLNMDRRRGNQILEARKNLPRDTPQHLKDSFSDAHFETITKRRAPEALQLMPRIPMNPITNPVGQELPEE
jgi:hypothetical protein